MGGGEYYRKRRPDHLAVVQSNARTSGRSPETPTTPRQLLDVGCGFNWLRIGQGRDTNGDELTPKSGGCQATFGASDS